MFRPASCSLYLLCSQENERKTNSFLFFSLFTVQSSCSVGDLFSCGLWNLLVVPCSGTEPWLPALGTQSRSPWIIREVPMSFLNLFFFFRFSSVQLLGHVRLFATPWTTALQTSLSITNSQKPPKSMLGYLFKNSPLLLISIYLDNILQLGDFFFFKTFLFFLPERFLIL